MVEFVSRPSNARDHIILTVACEWACPEEVCGGYVFLWLDNNVMKPGESIMLTSG